jgi:SNF2 family DNA or RNA helicase
MTNELLNGITTNELTTNFEVEYTPKSQLRPHQIITFNLLFKKDRFLISDQEGVGKTPPILCSHEAKMIHGKSKWGLYVTKAALIYDVYNQAKKFTNLKVAVIAGNVKKRIDMYYELEKGDLDLIVVSYELFRQDFDQLYNLHIIKPFGVFYADEAHKFRNTVQSQIAYLMHKLDTPQRYAITATPIINDIIDCYNILSWIGALPFTYEQFLSRYCDNNRSGKIIGYKNTDEIKSALQKNMLRRLKVDVLKDLPPVTSHNMYVELTSAQKKLYRIVEEADENHEFLDLTFENISTEYVKYTRLSQIAESTEIVGGEEGKKGSAKLSELETLLEEIIQRGEKAVVFSRSKKFTHIMFKFFRKYNPAIVTGDVFSNARAGQLVSDRQMQVDKFQGDVSCKVIFCVSASSREGLTLTSASNLIFTSKDFSPAYVSQAIGRIWRMGAQVHQSINVYSLLALETIDLKLEELLGEKQYTIENMVERA